MQKREALRPGKKQTNPGLFPRRVRRRNEWTACSAFCRCLHWLDDLSARQCVWRVARCPPWKLANEQQVEEKAGWVAWGSAGGSPKWCVWWSLNGYWGLAAPKVSSAAFWGQAASLHWLHVKISNHQTAMVSVIGCRDKSQLPLIFFFYLLSQYSFGAFALDDITKKHKLNSRKNCTLLADGIWLSGSDRNVNLQTHFLGQRSGCIPSCDSGGLNPSRVKGSYMVISIGVLLPIILLEQTQHGLSSGCWSHEELRVTLSWFPSDD